LGTPPDKGTSGEDVVQGRLRSPERVVALSDGVFAIILTILVLELKVPPHLSHESLGAALEEARPTLVAWIVSFLIVGMYWVAHRDIFARVRVVNRDLVWLNLLFLVPASLIPFAASVLGEYPDEPLAIQIYGTVIIAVAVMRLVVYGYVIRRPRLLWPQAISGKWRLALALAALPIVVSLIAMAAAPTSTDFSIGLFLSVPVLYFLAVTIAREGGDSGSEAEEVS
jgi:uncharacterized membrane protein